MKKHLSIICIFSFIISIISTPLVTHASENTIPDSNFVNYDAVVTGNYNNDIFLDEINNSGYVEGSPITSNFEKNQYNFSEILTYHLKYYLYTLVLIIIILHLVLNLYKI